MAVADLTPAGDVLPLSEAKIQRRACLGRVLHLVNGEHYAGAERVQDLLALRLPEFGFDVGFACLKAGQFADARRSQDAPLVELPMRSRFDLRPVWQLARLIQGHGYSLLHTHTPRTALLGRIAARLAGVPMVHHLHSPTSADTTYRWRNRLNRLSERFSLTGVAAVIAVSHSLANYARQSGIREKRLSVVPNGVPVQGPLAEREAPHDAWTLGTVALFRPRKGLEVLLESLALLRSQGFSVRLRAVGGFETAEYESTIKSHVARLALQEAIDWVGFTRNVAAELAAMDLFVLPSLFGEGLPMVILEAMAAGVPVVGTRVEGVPEAIRDGLDGLIATPGDAEDLARALRRVIAGDVDWQTLRTSAHERQARRFSDGSMAEGVAEIYQRVLFS